MMLFSLSGTGIDAGLKENQTCSLGMAPRLQAYCLKKTKKEKLRCHAQANYFKAALNNSLHFINNDVLNNLMPF